MENIKNITLFDEIINLNEEHDDACSEVCNTCRVLSIEADSKYNKMLVAFLIFALVLSVFIGIALGNTVFCHDVYGANTVCYVTYTGNCYHAGNCGSLWNSRIKTTVYKAKRSGKRACQRCKITYIDKSVEQEYDKGIMLCLAISVPTVFFVRSSAKSKKNEEIKNDREKRIREIDEKYANKILSMIKEEKILKIVNAPDNVFLRDNNLVYSDDSYYRYISRYGTCYHSNPYCGRNYLIKKSIFEIQGFYPCSKCAVEFDIPEWYNNYRVIRDIKNKYSHILNSQ